MPHCETTIEGYTAYHQVDGRLVDCDGVGVDIGHEDAEWILDDAPDCPHHGRSRLWVLMPPQDEYHYWDSQPSVVCDGRIACECRPDWGAGSCDELIYEPILDGNPPEQTCEDCGSPVVGAP